MALDADHLLGLKTADHIRRYTADEVRRYALSVGFGADPLNTPELEFVCPGRNLRAVPTMASIFGEAIVELTRACHLERPELALHAEQKLELLAPLPAETALAICGSISAVHDRGADRGAEIHMQAEARLADSGQPVYRTTYVTIARGDGGFGGPPPTRRRRTSLDTTGAPAARFSYATPRNLALLYSLNGDTNPIHINPEIACKAGFEIPILHGLCTYGIACRAVLATACEYDSDRIRTFDARFSAPVLPGDTLTVDVWKQASEVAFQVRAEERGTVVLKRGRCLLTE
ncbi:MaoC family dehydratase [Elongatibacter sediminis]|uniref:MaoC/PaaZ C-terminal domain-containing protein n=1 Tax=Elongatibacter sediminis TaxID=3119006 RepID=A0AAW9RLJ0_9GAMM